MNEGICLIGIDKTDGLILKRALKDLDSKFQSEEELDGRNLQEERNRIERIIRDINIYILTYYDYII